MGLEGAPNFSETVAIKFAASRVSHMRNVPHKHTTRLACIAADEPMTATLSPQYEHGLGN
jgi:hypothetical protein